MGTLPAWYQLRPVTESLPVDINDAFRLIVQRINNLTQLKMQSGEISGIFEERLIQEEQEKEELISHILLRIATVLDLRLTSWLLESEGDYFIFRFQQEPWDKQWGILTNLFGNDGIIDEQEIKMMINDPDIDLIFAKRRQNSSPIFAIKYTQAPFLLKKRVGRLVQGWIVLDLKTAIPFIKKEFERQLKNQMEQLQQRVKTRAQLKKQAMQFYEYVQKDVFEKIMKPRRETILIDSSFHLEGKLEENMEKFPPCIQDLLQRVENEGYIGHWERFQLGIFLKQIGMPVEEQLQFWYSKAVDNIGISFEEFKKKAGYIIRHIYGLEGGKIDYKMPACKTIQDRMYCSFKHASLETIKRRIEFLMKFTDIDDSKPISQLIVDKARKGDYSLACGLTLNIIRKHKGSTTRIQHPLIYLKLALESNDKEEKKEETKQQI